MGERARNEERKGRREGWIEACPKMKGGKDFVCGGLSDKQITPRNCIKEIV